jgi:hypothetical protein
LRVKKNGIEQGKVVKECRSGRREEVGTYEQIRQIALDRAEGKNGDYGCAVLINRGMAAWLRALGEYTPVRTVRPRSTEPARGEDVPELREEIVGVLIRMAFPVAR